MKTTFRLRFKYSFSLKSFKGDELHALGKVIIGAILVIISVWYVMKNPFGYTPTAWQALKTVIHGIVPIFVFLVGLFIVWLEIDELRVEKELKTTRTRKPRRKKRRR